MKPVFKCDYCAKMGTEEEIKEHEPICTDNYDRRSCYTCEHKSVKMTSRDGKWCYECKVGKEIPEGKIFEFCESHKRKEKSEVVANLFGDLFGFGL